jgi:hypothetical protein
MEPLTGKRASQFSSKRATNTTFQRKLPVALLVFLLSAHCFSEFVSLLKVLSTMPLFHFFSFLKFVMKRKMQKWNNRKHSIEVANEYPLSKGHKREKEPG